MVGLLFSFGVAANVPRYLRALPSEELPVVQTSLALEEDLENVVDNENTNSEANSVSNSVNVLDNTHNIVTPVVTPVIAPVVSVEAPTKTPTAHHQFRLVSQPASKTVTTSHVTNPVHTISSVQTAPVQTVSAVVKSQSAPIARKTVSTVPTQQYYYSVVPQTQQYSSVKGNSSF